MSFLITILIIIVLVIAALAIVKKSNGDVEPPYPYQSKVTLLTPTEMKFYIELKDIVDGKYAIFSHVRMEDIIRVKKGIDKKKAYGFRGRIKSRHIDFLLCNPEDCSIVLAIELDDKSHNNARAMKADKFKDKAFKDAGVPLIRFKVKSSYSEDIKEKLMNTIGFNKDQIVLPLDITNRKAIENKKLCPKCSSVMKERKANQGKHAGKSFLTCSTYPQCKTILPLN